MPEPNNLPICPECKTPHPPGTPPSGSEVGPLGQPESGGGFTYRCENCGYEGPFNPPEDS